MTLGTAQINEQAAADAAKAQKTPLSQKPETGEEYYAVIRRRLADVKAGRNIVHNDLIEVD